MKLQGQFSSCLSLISFTEMSQDIGKQGWFVQRRCIRCLFWRKVIGAANVDNGAPWALSLPNISREDES